MVPLVPFGNLSRNVEGLKFEHSSDAVAIYGSVDIQRSKEGLEKARRLVAELGAIVEYLEGDAIPETIASPGIEIVLNPFEDGDAA